MKSRRMSDNSQGASTSRSKDAGGNDSTTFSRPGQSLSRKKITPSSDSSPCRLPSLRGPRDLTLGGIKKKTFTPNIPVRKEKVKLETSKNDETPLQKPDRPKRHRSRDRRNRGRGGGDRGGFHKQEIIQSHSIFEAGPSAELTTNRGRKSYSEASGSVAKIEKPTIKKESYNQAEEKMESDEVMRKLDEESACFIADLQNDEKLKPLTLPMLPHPLEAMPIKQEPGSISGAYDNFVTKDPSMLSHVFQSPCDEMLLFQIPDTIPGVAPSNSVTDFPIKQEPGVSAMRRESKQETKEANGRCSIDQLSEGFVGKLQVLKSGKCRLVLGDVTLDMKLGTPSSFAEELVSIKLPPEGNPDSSKGHLTVLSNITHKLICIPDMTSLIQP